MPAKWKTAFAVLAVGILIASILATVEEQRINGRDTVPPTPGVRVIDLDFQQVSGEGHSLTYLSVGPFGTVEVGTNPTGPLVTYWSGGHSVSLRAAGASYASVELLERSASDSPIQVEGVVARYPTFYPLTSLELVAGIDGAEAVLVLRSPLVVSRGDLEFSFWVDTSSSLQSGLAREALMNAGSGPRITNTAIPLRDGAGRTVFNITPAVALIDYFESDALIGHVPFSRDPEIIFPAHYEGERLAIPLDYRVEFVDGRMKLSVLVPTDLLLDPAIKWPVRIDPGITNPISGSAFFTDETILMDSDLVVTSSGVAQFSNVSLIMNGSSSPNYNITVGSGGRITFLDGTVRSNSSSLPFGFWLNGTMLAHNTSINNTREGVRSLSGNVTLSNVTLNAANGVGLYFSGTEAAVVNATVVSSSGTGVEAYRSQLETLWLNVSNPGGDGIYLNASQGNLTSSSITSAAINGLKIVNGSRVNVTQLLVDGSDRNGVLVIGGSPTINNSEIRWNGWSGIVLVDDHSSYVANNTIHNNTGSGIEAAMNSTADIYGNSIADNRYGIFVNASDPNVEHNTVRYNTVGIYLEGAHKSGLPGSSASTESSFPGSLFGRTPSMELPPEGIRTFLSVPEIDVWVVGPNETERQPGETASFLLRVDNNQAVEDTAALSIDDDEWSWSSLNRSSITIAPQGNGLAVLNISVPSGANCCTSYNVRVWANGTPSQHDAVWVKVYVKWASALNVSNATTGDNSTVTIYGRLLNQTSPMANANITFDIDGIQVGYNFTDSNGYVRLDVLAKYPRAIQTITLRYAGTGCQQAAVATDTLTINPVNTILQATPQTGRYSDLVGLTARVITTATSVGVSGVIVHFSLNGTYLGPATTDVSGHASYAFIDTRDPDNVTWNASFDGLGTIVASSNSSTFETLKEITVVVAYNFTVKYGYSGTYVAWLLDDEGGLLASKTVSFARNGVWKGDGTTNATGYASNLDSSIGSLSAGDYSINSSYAGDSHYLAAYTLTNLAVANYTTFIRIPAAAGHYTDSVSLKAQLVDEMGTNVSGKSLTFKVDGTTVGSANSDSNGWATVSWTANLAASTYYLNVSFGGDMSNITSNNTSTFTVLRESTVISVSSDSRVQVGGLLNITVRLVEDDGPHLAGRPLRAELAGAVYANGTTDGNGYWTFTFDTRGVATKRYEFLEIFDGEANFSAATAYTRVFVEHGADLYNNTIDHNTWGILADDSESVVVKNSLSDNNRAVEVWNGDLLLYNSTVRFSTTDDYKLDNGGSLYSTNSTFNRQKVAFGASGGTLYVRWFFNLIVLDSSKAPRPNTAIELKDKTGATVINRQVDANGELGYEAVTEYTQTASGKTIKTPHSLSFPALANSGAFLHIDTSKTLTIYYGYDKDLDGLPDQYESFDDVIWYEAEGHTVDGSQTIDEYGTSGGQAALKFTSDTRITDKLSFYEIPSGTWRALIRVAADDEDGRFKIVVSNPSDTVLLTEEFPTTSEYRWFLTNSFPWSSVGAVRIAITDESTSPTTSRVRVDRLGLYREFDSTPSRTHWPGQAADPFLPDGDFDFAPDGFEIRAHSFWYEAEWQSPSWPSLTVERTDASGGYTLEHPMGSKIIVTYTNADVTTLGDYLAIVRVWNGAGTPTASVEVEFTHSNDPTVSFTKTYTIGENYTTLQVPFNYRIITGSTFILKINDVTDVTPFTDPQVEVDKVGLIRVYRDPFPQADVSPSSNDAPDSRITPVIARGAGDDQGYLFYASTNGNLVKVPLTPIYNGNTPQAPTTVAIGQATTELVLLDFPMPLIIVGSVSGGNGWIYAIERNMMTVFSSVNLGPGATPNGIAAKEWNIYFTTLNGVAFAYQLTPVTLTNLWANNLFATMGGSHGGAAIHTDQVYYPFDGGLAVYSINPATAGTLRWSLTQFPDPCSALPPSDPFTCQAPPPPPPPPAPGPIPTACGLSPSPPPLPLPGPFTAVVGGIMGTPVFDMGHVYFIVEAPTVPPAPPGDRFVLYHYDEQGNILWARDLNWTGSVNAPYRAHLLIKDCQVIATGDTIDSINKLGGNRLWLHNFGLGIPPMDIRWAPVATDGLLIFPYDGTLFAFAQQGINTGMPDQGTNGMNDGTFGAGALFAEDTVWTYTLSGIDHGQPLFGDFDNDGYFDVVMLNGATVLYLTEVVAQYRSYTPWQQYGLDSNRKGEADYQIPYFATDPLDHDFDHDGILDSQEIVTMAGYDIIEAEDAVDWNAWNNAEDRIGLGVPGEKNFNFIHQFGATLTSGYTLGSQTTIDDSYISLRFSADKTGTYRFSIRPASATIVDVRFVEGATLMDPGTANPANGYGSGGYSERGLELPTKDVLPTSPMAENATAIMQAATYVLIGYDTGASIVYLPVLFTMQVNLAQVRTDPKHGDGVWLVVYASLEFTIELSGLTDYRLRLGLDLNRVSQALRTSTAFPDSVNWVRIEDIDFLRVDRLGMDPYAYDYDGDNVPDGEELSKGWYPLNADPDKDGLDDYQEWNGITVNGVTYKTNPGDRDTDHDGLRDRVELGFDQTDTSGDTIYDDSFSWGSYLESIAYYYKGDPLYTPTDTFRWIPNWDTELTNGTDPLDWDSDNDGIPDGWRDGWIYDSSGQTGRPLTYQHVTYYQRTAAPVRYNESHWHDSQAYDNFPQIWEGEDFNLDGAWHGDDTWGFYISRFDSDPTAPSSRQDFVKRYPKETDPNNRDTDSDQVPDGYEVWFATRAPILFDGGDPTPNPTKGSDANADLEREEWTSPSVGRYNGIGGITVRKEGSPNNGETLYAQKAYDTFGNPLNGSLTIYRLKLDLTSTDPYAVAELLLWLHQSACSSSTISSASLVVEGVFATVNPVAWTEFELPAPLSVDFDTPFCLYIGVKAFREDIFWNGGDTETANTFKMSPYDGSWTTVVLSQVNWEIYEAQATGPDGATLLEEYVAGTNPKVRNTDGPTGGFFTGESDKLTDGTETTGWTNGTEKPGRVIFRTNAQYGALEYGGYTSGKFVYYKKNPSSAPDVDWIKFDYSQQLTDPAAPFGGSATGGVVLFRLSDGSTFMADITANPEVLYLWLPGSDFTNVQSRIVGGAVQSHYRGTVMVFTKGTTESPWTTTALIRDANNALQDQYKMLFATAPWDWDSDDDGLGDGQEQWLLKDYENQVGGQNDWLNNARDPDSDGDGLGDGQEILTVCPNWNKAYYGGYDGSVQEPTQGADDCSYTTPARDVDPDNDDLFTMLDIDSDADGLKDEDEVDWAVDSDGSGGANLVDPDADGDLLCDGWCISEPWLYNGHQAVETSGSIKGEDANQNGRFDTGESSPTVRDTDNDGLTDGYGTATTSGERFLTSRFLAPGVSQMAFSGTTVADTDGDRILDGVEVAGYTIRTYTGEGDGTPSGSIRVQTDPTKMDTDGDGISDGAEYKWTNATNSDTDGDGITDGLENSNKNAFRDATETDPLRQDSDRDRITDADEIGTNGVRDSGEPDPLLFDTDGDGVSDGNERDLLQSLGHVLSWQSDNDGTPDLLDRDSDNDGLEDGVENADHDGSISASTEMDPTDADTDHDGLLDGAEPYWSLNSDVDQTINGRDKDSNDNVPPGETDPQQYWDLAETFVVFRTNAQSGSYGASGMWVAIDPTVNVAKTTGAYSEPDLSVGNALYVYNGACSVLPATLNIYYGEGATDNPVPLRTPEDYGVYYASSTNKICIEGPGAVWEFTHSTTEPSGYSSSPKPVQSFTASQEEVYEWRKALGSDYDFDGLSDKEETSLPANQRTNWQHPDSDGDLIRDGNERNWDQDFDGDGLINSMDTDSDNDGILDGTEDMNVNGRVDDEETDGLSQDSDGDSLADGLEDQNHNGLMDGGETSPIDADTDDDGLFDGEEDANQDRQVDDGETSALARDTDGDGILDGTELGRVSAIRGTDRARFQPDFDPSTTTTAAVTAPGGVHGLDSDNDGVNDGVEDRNRNGRVDPGETDPLDNDSDDDGSADGVEDANGNGQVDKAPSGAATETDPLLRDSDRDGITDGDERAGTWCYATEGTSCNPSDPDARKLNPLDQDFDDDGLADGDEISGWWVPIWWEGTFQKRVTPFVVSNPARKDSESNGVGDGVDDFEEFVHASDPQRADTDGDGLSDSYEVQHQTSLVAIEGSPPAISNIRVWYLIPPSLTLIPNYLVVYVDFDVTDNVGVERVDVSVKRGGVTRTAPDAVEMGQGGPTAPIAFVFDFLRGVGMGTDVSITARDVNGNAGLMSRHEKGLADYVNDIINWVKSTLVKPAVDAVSNLFENTIKPIIRDAFNRIVFAAAKKLGPAMRDALTGFFELFQTIASPTATLADAILGLDMDLLGLGFLKRAVMAIARLVEDLLRPFLSVIADLVRKVADFVRNEIKPAEVLGRLFGFDPSTMPDFASGLEKVESFLRSIIDGKPIGRTLLNAVMNLFSPPTPVDLDGEIGRAGAAEPIYLDGSTIGVQWSGSSADLEEEKLALLVSTDAAWPDAQNLALALEEGMAYDRTVRVEGELATAPNLISAIRARASVSSPAMSTFVGIASHGAEGGLIFGNQTLDFEVLIEEVGKIKGAVILSIDACDSGAVLNVRSSISPELVILASAGPNELSFGLYHYQLARALLPSQPDWLAADIFFGDGNGRTSVLEAHSYASFVIEERYGMHPAIQGPASALETSEVRRPSSGIAPQFPVKAVARVDSDNDGLDGSFEIGWQNQAQHLLDTDPDFDDDGLFDGWVQDLTFGPITDRWDCTATFCETRGELGDPNYNWEGKIGEVVGGNTAAQPNPFIRDAYYEIDFIGDNWIFDGFHADFYDILLVAMFLVTAGAAVLSAPTIFGPVILGAIAFILFLCNIFEMLLPEGWLRPNILAEMTRDFHAHGIEIRFDMGALGNTDSTLLHEVPLTTPADVVTEKAAHFDTLNRDGIFHYVLVANILDNPECWWDDLCDRGWNMGPPPIGSSPDVALSHTQIAYDSRLYVAVFMQEIGHGFGLMHTDEREVLHWLDDTAMSNLYISGLVIPGSLTRGHTVNTYTPEEWGMLDLPGSLA